MYSYIRVYEYIVSYVGSYRYIVIYGYMSI